MATILENSVKRKVRAGQKTVGGWLQIASPMAAEIMSRAGFDWLIIDMEHGPTDIPMLIAQLQAMSGTDVIPFVRAPWNDFVIIKRILDAGVYGVLIPYVNSKSEAEAAVAACKYPPQGIRGVAGSPRAVGFGQKAIDYLTKANDEIMVIVAVETFTAVTNIDDILKVPGIDGIFIGPLDLSASLGHIGEPHQPEVQSAIATIEAKVLATEKTLVTLAGNWQQAKELYCRGYQMVMVMADGMALANLAAEKVAQFRHEYPENKR